MTGETQRTLTGYKSNVREPGEFENPNEKKPLLDDSMEYVFHLKEMPTVRQFKELKDNKDGTRSTITKDKAICEFIEESTGNVVNAFFRVDSLNFSDDESFESAVIRFFRKIKKPLPEFAEPIWNEHFITGMRFRGRVQLGLDKDKNPTRKYYLDVPTCRPILESDKHPEAVAASKENDAATLANALFLAKGAKDHNEAMDMLKKANVSKDIAMAFFQADLDGILKYPIN